MNKTRCLGLVGGLGVGATVHSYQSLAKARQESGRTLDVVITHAETSRVYECVQAGDREGLAEYLLRFIRRMHAAGADVAAIPAVTPHFCVRELVARSPIPLLDLFHSLREELSARNIHRVAVFGTRFVIESDLFGLLPQVKVIQPRPEEVNQIHEIYTALAQRGEANSQQRKTLSSLAHTLCSREKVEAILLAGTDLSVLFNESNTDFPNIDCAALHIRAILRHIS
jgi:aspartate racemase